MNEGSFLIFQELFYILVNDCFALLILEKKDFPIEPFPMTGIIDEIIIE
jgi:hypothetical protein